MHRFFVLLFFLGFVQNSEAQMSARCFDLFATAQTGTVQYYAEFIDSLNKQSNQIIFSQALSEKINPTFDDMVFKDRVSARFQAYKLKRLLKQLKNADGIDAYDFEVLATKLERLTFLTDPTVTNSMSAVDKAVYKQAQHSILAKGLENFLFDSTIAASKSMKRKIFDLIMVPFKEIYFRWSYAYLSMPKLNGAVLPTELALKIAWSGIEANRVELAPYLKDIKFKKYFNQFSKTYNWMLVSAIFVGLPTYGYITYHNAVVKGQQHFEQMMAPVIGQVDAMSTVIYVDQTAQKRLENFTIQFRQKKHREPTAAEIELAKNLIENN